VSSALPSHRSMVAAIVAKDARAFTRDRFWLFMTCLAVAWFIALYYLLPSTVNETIRAGVYWTDTDAAYAAAFPAQEGVQWVRYASLQDLQSALGVRPPASTTQGNDLWERAKSALGIGQENTVPEVAIGIAYPQDFLVDVVLGAPTSVTLYARPDVPDEERQALETFIRESAYSLVGDPLPVSVASSQTAVLGTDRAGAQVPLKDKMRPLYAFVMLMMETFALGALIGQEVSSRTVTAVLATPATAADFLAGKAIIGTVVAFTEAVLVMALVRAFGHAPLLLLGALLLGGVLVTGVAMIVGASGRDFIGMIFLSLLFMVPLAIPAFAVLFPGTSSGWVKVLPTYGLTQAIVQITTYQANASDVAAYLAGLAGWCVVTLAVGFLVLRRKVATL
jgi:ABC-2 type transport system permease protein